MTGWSLLKHSAHIQTAGYAWSPLKFFPTASFLLASTFQKHLPNKNKKLGNLDAILSIWIWSSHFSHWYSTVWVIYLFKRQLSKMFLKSHSWHVGNACYTLFLKYQLWTPEEAVWMTRSVARPADHWGSWHPSCVLDKSSAVWLNGMSHKLLSKTG